MDNTDADALSRYGHEDAPREDEEPVRFPHFSIRLEGMENIELRSLQIEDKHCNSIIDHLEGSIPEPSDRLKRMAIGHYLDHGILRMVINNQGPARDLLVVPKSMWQDVCQRIHAERTGLGYFFLCIYLFKLAMCGRSFENVRKNVRTLVYVCVQECSSLRLCILGI